MMNPFTISCPTRIRFGSGTSHDIAQVLPPGTGKVAFVQGAGGAAAAPVLARLRAAGRDVVVIRCPGEPSVASVNAALDQIDGAAPDAVVACGGGSVMDTGKALAFALSQGLRLDDEFDRIAAAVLETPGRVGCIALPTTAGTGAEVTANAVLDVPSRGAKISLRGRAIFATDAIVDPELMISAPRSVALHAGLDAITQVIEAYTSAAATPFSDALSRPAIASGLTALRRVMTQGDAQAWQDLAWTSLSSGLALANGGLGAAHGLASVIGGQFGAPHGALCGRFLVPVLRRNLARADPGSQIRARLEECCALVAGAFPSGAGADPLAGLEAWADGLDLPRLGAWGVSADRIEALAAQGVEASSSRKNGVALTVDDHAEILRAAL